MERAVRVAAGDEVDGAAAAVDRHGLDGVEIDLSGMAEADYRRVRDMLQAADVDVIGLHDDRTGTVSMQERELFRSQLDRTVERAERLGISVISIHPPRAEIGEAHTVRDLQRFMGDADGYAADAEVELCFRLAGFMQDPEMLNLGLETLHRPALAAMVDLDDLVPGADPVEILRKFEVRVRKLKVPVSVPEMDERLADLPGDVMVVADL